MSNGMTPLEALDEMREVTRMAALDGSLPRQAAMRYTFARDALLQSHLRSYLPGFLIQCLTIARFHDFIHLLDPRPEVRLSFLDDAFRNVGMINPMRPGIDVFGDDEDF